MYPNCLMNITLSTRRLSWALLLALPLWFGACSKSTTDVTPNSIEGSWRLTGYTIDPAIDLAGNGTKTNDILGYYALLPGGSQYVECYKAITLTFAASGKITGTTTTACSGIDASPFASTATWASTTAGKVKITDGTDVQEYDVNISGTTLKLSQTFTDDFDGDGKTENGTVALVMTKA
nr:hypothetical protein A6C57_06080 [Fibrella sp. ES10-3-2-2]